MATLRLIVDPSGAKRGYREATQAGDRFKRGARGVETQTGRVRGSFDRLKQSAFSLKGAFAAIGIAAVVRSFGSLLKASSDFETGLVGVAKTTGLAGRDLNELAGRLRTVSTEIAVPTDELLGMAQAAGQMGVTGVDNLERFSVTVAKLGRASDLAGDEAATALARILNVTGENISEIDTLASVIVSLGNNVAATESEIANMTNRIAQSTSAAGLSSAEIAAMGAALTSMGVRAEAGGTAIGRVFAQMQLAVSQGGDTLDEFARALDLNAEKFAEVFEDDKVAGFELLLEGIARQGKDAGAALEEAGLSGVRVAQSLIPLAQNLDEYRRTQGLANDEVENATALNREFAAALDTFDNRLQNSGNIVQEWKRRLGEDALPTITTALMAWNAGMRESFAEADNALHNNEVAFVNWSNIVNSSLAFAIDFVRSATEIIKKAFEATGRFIGGIAAAIQQALTFDFSGARTTINEVSADFQELESQLFDFSFARFSDNLNKVQNQLKFKDEIAEAEDLFNALSSGIPVLNGVSRASGDMADSSDDAADSVDDLGNNAGDTEEDLNSLANVIGRSVNPNLEALRDHGREAMEQFDRFADAILSQTPIAGAKLATLDETIQAIESDTGEAGDTALVTFRSMEQIAEDTASGIRDSWVDTFDKLFRGQIDSVKDFVGSVKDLFIRMIAEISASLVASKLFEFFNLGGGGSFSLPNLGDLFGGGGDGGMLNLASIGASLKGGAGKIAGALGLTGAASSGAVATPIAAAGGAIAPTAVLTGGAIEAGTGLAASAGGAVSTGAGGAAGGGFSAGLAAIGPQIGVLAAPFIARELFGGGNVDKLIGQAGQSLQGAQMQPGGAGTQIGAQGGFGVASGANIGFVAATDAAKNMSTAIVELDENTRAFKDVTMREMIEITAQAEVKFEQLKTRGASMFADLGVSGRQMGNILRDGLVNESERAALGLQHIGAVIENPKTGMKELGDLSVSQFDRITEAVQKGEIRLSALQGKTELSSQEMRRLGEIGVGAHSKIVDSARNAEGAEKSFGNTASTVMSMVDRTSAAAAKSFGSSFQSAANDASSAISNFSSSGVSALDGMSTAAKNLAKRMGEIPTTVDVKINQTVSKSGGQIPGAQHGAVLSGPKSGFLAELHGTEAVIPIKNGSVPVEIQGGGGKPMVVNINQTINGGDPQEIARATRREFQRVANEFPIR